MSVPKKHEIPNSSATLSYDTQKSYHRKGFFGVGACYIRYIQNTEGNSSTWKGSTKGMRRCSGLIKKKIQSIGPFASWLSELKFVRYENEEF